MSLDAAITRLCLRMWASENITGDAARAYELGRIIRRANPLDDMFVIQLYDIGMWPRGASWSRLSYDKPEVWN